MIRPNVMPMTEPDPKFLKLMRDLDEERTA
jgi:hypothetical protein